MKSTEIRAQIDKLLRDKDAITKQLNEAKRRAKESGDYSDADWFRRAEAAERMASRQINRLQADLGAALKAERQQQHTARELTFERAFVRFAREVLPRETYDRLVRDASAQAHQPAGVAPAMDLQPPVDNAFVAPGCELFSSMPPVAAATAAQPERKPLNDDQRRRIILDCNTLGEAIAATERAHNIGPAAGATGASNV